LAADCCLAHSDAKEIIVAKFAPSFIDSLINPSYLPGMFTAAQAVGAAPGEMRRKKLLDEEMKIFNQGVAATRQDVADPSALSMRIRQLTELLPQASREDALRIQKNINTLSDLYDKTKQTADANKITSIISAENALTKLSQESGFEETDQFAGPLSDEQYNRRTARDALQKRVAELKSDPKVALQVENYKIDAEYNAFKKQTELLAQKELMAVRALRAAEYGSDSYKNLAKQLESQGLGSAIDTFEAKHLEAIQIRQQLADEKALNKPPTKDERDSLKAIGLPVTQANVRTMRKRNLEANLDVLFRDTDILNKVQAESEIRFALGQIAKEGDYWDLVFFDDIDEKINELTTADHQELLGLVEGRQRREAEPAVRKWLQEKFPNAWERSQAHIENKNKEAQVRARGIQATFEASKPNVVKKIMEREANKGNTITQEEAENIYETDAAYRLMAERAYDGMGSSVQHSRPMPKGR
jgi:hypothetical protein